MVDLRFLACFVFRRYFTFSVVTQKRARVCYKAKTGKKGRTVRVKSRNDQAGRARALAPFRVPRRIAIFHLVVEHRAVQGSSR